ncbi:MAG: type II toxin-antitoxin system ParD family antitoxin [Prochloraceae cyanobacterium]|nr:type II toxin-antitoxin system ParD family antitoxin [Prochloraceae cyanobacterium]
MEIKLKPEQEQFISDQIKKGKYQNAEQLISEALNLLEKKLTQTDKITLEELRQKIEVGREQIAKGQVTDGELVFSQLLDKLRREYGVEN